MRGLAPWRWPLALSVTMLLPVINLLLLLVPNAATLVFPAWVGTTARRGGGIEVVGQRLIFVFGFVFALALGLLPGALVGGVVWWGAQWAIGPTWAVPVGAIGALFTSALEVALGVWLLGKAFVRFDISAER